jgi:Tfp pilus assembly protein PilX
MIMRVTQLSRRLTAALSREEGVAMVITLGVMVITLGLVVAAFTSASGEVHLAAADTEQKKAYYAAEAGIEDYEYHLTEDGNYLSECTSPTPTNEALNQFYREGTETPIAASELKTVEVPEVEVENKETKSIEHSHSEEKYALQLIPAESDTREHDKECDPKHLVETMVEEKGPATGTFRIESTGFSGKATRSIVATFRNANFVSYVWYTMYEVADPVVFGEAPPKEPNYWTECAKFYEQREKLAKDQCKPLNNFFATGESVNGPMHVQDHSGICGEPTLGRNSTDRIEFGNGTNKLKTAESYSDEGQCGAANPKFVGTHVPAWEVPSLEPPPGDEELIHVVEEKYHFHGRTEIILEPTAMKVRENYKEALPAGSKKYEYTEKINVPYPPNGVIYVSGAPEVGSCPTYSPFGPTPGYAYSEGDACGNAYVHGEYEESLTIASENDVIINGNITAPMVPKTVEGTPTTNDMLGLIANNFVRIYHPLTGTRGSKYLECGSATNDKAKTPEIPEDLNEPVVDAAMLAVKHAVIVDNFDCGNPELGHLNVFGALAGLYSNGLTGVISGTTIVHGYTYNAHYDNRLQVEEPPHFLNPIEAAWYIQRQTLASQP